MRSLLVGLAVVASLSEAGAARVGMTGDSKHAQWSSDHIKHASLTDSIFHLSSLPPAAANKYLPGMNVVHRPRGVVVALVEGEYSGSIPLTQSEEAWNPDELYRSMEMVKSTVHKVDMSWSHKGSLERRNSAAPHSQWVYEGVFDAPSKDVNGKLDIQKKGSTWTISNKETSVSVTDASTWEKSLLSEVSQLLPSDHRAQHLSVVTINSLKECADSSKDCSAAVSLLDSALAEVAHRGAVVLVVSDLEDVSRSLADATPAPTAYHATNYTITEIVQYQINLWASIGLVLVLLSAICCMVNMDIQPDSLLYAKFQADVSSKLE